VRSRQYAAVILIAMTGIVWLARAPVALADPGTPANVKYYVVGAEGTYLYAVASRTLGNGNRYKEIFELNKDRRQPDGKFLTDHRMVEPGWILILPADASGPGVQEGPLPGFPAPPAPVSWKPAGLAAAAAVLTITCLVYFLRLKRRRPTTSQPGLPAAHPPATPAPLAIVAAADWDSPSRSLALAPIPRLELTVGSGPDELTIRTIGLRPDFGKPFAGRGGSEPDRPDGAVVTLGDGLDAVWLDLAASPDVIRLTGTRIGVRRQAREMAHQLQIKGIATVSAADVPGVSDLANLTITSPADLAHGSALDIPIVVAFLGQVDQAHAPTLHQVVKRNRPRVVAVVVGPGPGARWTINVGDADLSRR
jgi:hypothetical protein